MATGTFSIIDLFSGCGGLSFGFSLARFNILLGLDTDLASLNTFKMNHKGSVVIRTNVEFITGDLLAESVNNKKIDVIVGGPPCQGISLSGPREMEDPRNKLFLSFVRLTDELKPKAFVLENVPGILSLFNGKIGQAIIDEFSKIGYSVSVSRLLAADYGVPQLRKRVVFVGLRGKNEKFRFPEPTNFPIESIFVNQGKSPFVTCREAIGDLPSLEGNPQNNVLEYPTDALCDYQSLMRQGSIKIYNHELTKHQEKVKKIISLVPEGGNYMDLPLEYKNSRNFHVAWTRYHSDKPAPTIDTGHRHHFHYKYNRVPTVRECARLQSFPDRFIFYGNKGQQYRQVGNAVPPLLAKAIAQELLKWL